MVSTWAPDALYELAHEAAGVGAGAVMVELTRTPPGGVVVMPAAAVSERVCALLEARGVPRPAGYE